MGSGLDSCCSPAARLTEPGFSPNISAMKAAMRAALSRTASMPAELREKRP